MFELEDQRPAGIELRVGQLAVGDTHGDLPAQQWALYGADRVKDKHITIRGGRALSLRPPGTEAGRGFVPLSVGL